MADEERRHRIVREYMEDEADRLPVTVRGRNGEPNVDETRRINRNNRTVDMDARINRREGRPAPLTEFTPEEERVPRRASNAVTGYKSGGMVKNGRSRGDGCASRGKTKGRHC